MLSVTGTLAAAITALVRRPRQSVVVDWAGDGTPGSFDDLSASVTSLVVDRAITTDLPAEANIVEGDAAGQATITLGVDINGVSPAQLLSPYTAHLAGARRVGAPVTVRFGFRGEAGTEYVPALVGKVRTVGTSDDGTATLTTLDGPELLRTAVTLPVFVVIDPATGIAPSLDGGWAMDQVLRRNGLYATPPLRASCVLHAPMQGSTWPDVGTLTRSQANGAGASGKQGGPTFTTMTKGRGVYLEPSTASSINLDYLLASPLSVNQNTDLFIELGQVRVTRPASSEVILWQLGAGTGAALGAAYVQVNCNSFGSIVVAVSRNGLTDSVALGTLPNGIDTYLAVHIQWTAGGATVRVRIGSTTSTDLLVVGNPTGNPALNYASYVGGYVFPGVKAVNGVQVTTEAYSAGMFNDDFVPTAVLQPSLNELTAMPAVEDRMPWPLLQEVVEAEQGVILFDEEGIVRFYNRDHMTGGTAVAVMRAVKELKGVSASETIDSVRNIVRVPAAPLTIDTAGSVIWTISETLVIGGFRTLIVPASFEGPAVEFDTSFVYMTLTPPGIESGYRAARNSDGTGGDVSNLSITFAQYPARLVMFITNPNAFDVWLVNNSIASGIEPNVAGRPMLQIAGRLARAPENPYTSRAADAASIIDNGEQPLDVGENIWRQSVSAAESLSASLLAMLKEPHAVLNGVEVVGDPRRQLTDRVTLVDTEGIGWARDVWLLGITNRLDGGGLSQSVAVREAGSATSGMTGTFIWDVSLWDSLDGWVA